MLSMPSQWRKVERFSLLGNRHSPQTGTCLCDLSRGIWGTTPGAVAEVNIVGTWPQTRRSRTRMTGSFLGEPPVSAQVQELYNDDLADSGYVWNVSRLWAHQPDTLKRLYELMSQAFTPSGLTFRQRGILVAAATSTLGDSYCSLAWGGKLGQASDA